MSTKLVLPLHNYDPRLSYALRVLGTMPCVGGLISKKGGFLEVIFFLLNTRLNWSFNSFIHGVAKLANMPSVLHPSAYLQLPSRFQFHQASNRSIGSTGVPRKERGVVTLDNEITTQTTPG